MTLFDLLDENEAAVSTMPEEPGQTDPAPDTPEPTPVPQPEPSSPPPTDPTPEPAPPEPATPPSQQVELPNSNIFERAVCLHLSFSNGIGDEKKIPRNKIAILDDDGVSKDQGVDKTRIRGIKKILECKEYDAIAIHDKQTKDWVKKRCLPSIFRSSFYLLPIDMIERCDQYLEGRKVERQQLVDQFMAVYPTLVANAGEALSTLHNADDYPSQDYVRAGFQLRTQYVSFGVPGTLKAISKDIFKREQEKAVSRWAEATVEIQGVLREAMAELVSRAVDRLTPGPDGKQKVFRDTLVDNIKDFIDTFSSRNITNDQELAQLVTQARDLLDGVTPNGLRKSSTIREKVRAGLDQLKNQMAGMVVTKGRQMHFDE